jgi:carboxymethylenebutenolidase
MVKITRGSEVLSCYSSTAGNNSPGVLVLHAWWGLNDFVRGFCDRLAGEGFSAVAPDLYRGRIARTVERAEHLRDELDEREASGMVDAALDHLLADRRPPRSSVGVAGFSLGGRFALDLSESRQEVKSVVTFYATSPRRRWSSSKAGYLGHFAEADPYESAPDVLALERSLKSAGMNVEFYTYPGTGHWFFESDRPGAYDRAASDLAWKRTIGFLSKTLGVNEGQGLSPFRGDAR